MVSLRMQVIFESSFLKTDIGVDELFIYCFGIYKVAHKLWKRGFSMKFYRNLFKKFTNMMIVIFFKAGLTEGEVIYVKLFFTANALGNAYIEKRFS